MYSCTNLVGVVQRQSRMVLVQLTVLLRQLGMAVVQLVVLLRQLGVTGVQLIMLLRQLGMVAIQLIVLLCQPRVAVVQLAVLALQLSQLLLLRLYSGTTPWVLDLGTSFDLVFGVGFGPPLAHRFTVGGILGWRGAPGLRL